MPQSTICADTGNQATITFAEGITDSYKIREIDQTEQSVGPLDCSTLENEDEKTLVAEDLSDPSEINIEWLWDTFETPPVPGLYLGTVTITYPTRTGETTPATRAGTGYVAAVKHPKLANNELQVGTCRIQLDGATKAVWTKST